MKLASGLLAAAAAAALSVAPAQAGGHVGGSSGGTAVPEPSDAILLLMGVAGVVIGRRLHARARRKT